MPYILRIIVYGYLLVLLRRIKKKFISRIMDTALFIRTCFVGLFGIFTCLGIVYIALPYLLFIFIDIGLRLFFHEEQDVKYDDISWLYVEVVKNYINGFIEYSFNLLFKLIRFVIYNWREFIFFFVLMLILDKMRSIGKSTGKISRIHTARRNLRRAFHIDNKSISNTRHNSVSNLVPIHALNHQKRSTKRIHIARRNLRRIFNKNSKVTNKNIKTNITPNITPNKASNKSVKWVRKINVARYNLRSIFNRK